MFMKLLVLLFKLYFKCLIVVTWIWRKLIISVVFFFLHKIRLCALNDDSSEESDHEPTQESVKQAKVGNTLIISCSCTVQLMN